MPLKMRTFLDFMAESISQADLPEPRTVPIVTGR